MLWELLQISASLHDEVLRKLSILNSDALDHLLNYIVSTNRNGYEDFKIMNKMISTIGLTL